MSRRRIHYQATSRDAWQSFLPVSAVLDRAILEAITASPEGLTDLELEQATGRKHQAVSANRRHLVEDGFLVDSGRRRTQVGRARIVWALPEPKDGT